MLQTLTQTAKNGADIAMRLLAPYGLDIDFRKTSFGCILFILAERKWHAEWNLAQQRVEEHSERVKSLEGTIGGFAQHFSGNASWHAIRTTFMGHDLSLFIAMAEGYHTNAEQLDYLLHWLSNPQAETSRLEEVLRTTRHH